MVDRALTFRDPKIVDMLKTHFVPVAIDQWYQRRQQDTEGEFYRKIAGQGPRKDFNLTTQGRYICLPDGKLIAYNNNRGPEKIRKLMMDAVANFNPKSLETVKPIAGTKADPKYERSPPENGLTLRVHTKVMSGYQPTDDYTSVFHNAIGRDNVWLKSEEKDALAEIIRRNGAIPTRISERIARFHLVDNTRGEPPRWSKDEIKVLKLKIEDGVVTGLVSLKTADGKRGYEAKIMGVAKANGKKITRFDLVAKGLFWGEGPWTHAGPEGKFPLLVTFRVADGSDPSDKIVPHGGKGWLDGYYE